MNLRAVLDPSLLRLIPFCYDWPFGCDFAAMGKIQTPTHVSFPL